MADLKTTTNGDLNLARGLQIATDMERDRHVVTVRLMTVQGDYQPDPTLGVSSRSIGQPITGDLLQQVEEDVLESILRDFGTRGLNPVVKAVPTGPQEITVFVQINKQYSGTLGDHITIQGNYWNRDEEITLLDGSEG